MSNWNDHAYFDLGTREQTDENATYHGNGWHKDSGDTVLNPWSDIQIVLREDGSLDVWKDQRRAW